MTRKAKTRTKTVRIKITDAAYRIAAESAFQNCREIGQELSFIVERQLSTMRRDKSFTVLAPLCGDDTKRYDSPEPELLSAATPPESGNWDQAQEDEITAMAKEKNISEAQLSAYRFLHKTPEAVKEAMLSDSGVTA